MPGQKGRIIEFYIRSSLLSLTSDKIMIPIFSSSCGGKDFFPTSPLSFVACLFWTFPPLYYRANLGSTNL